MSQKTNKLQFDYSYYREYYLTAPIMALLVAGLMIGMLVYNIVANVNANSYSGIGPFLKDNGGYIFFIVMVIAVSMSGFIPSLRSGMHLLKENPKDAILVTGTIEKTFMILFFGIPVNYAKRINRGYQGIVLNGTKYYLPNYGEFEKGDTVTAMVLPKSKLILEMVLSGDRPVTEQEIADTRVNKVKFDYEQYLRIYCVVPSFACMFVLLTLAGCIYGFITYPDLNPLTPGRIMSLIIPVFLLFVSCVPLMRGGIHLYREKEKDAVIISGTIEEVFDLPQIGVPYSNFSMYPNNGFGQGIVLGGTEYYLPDVSAFRAGDRIFAKVLPKSRLVLEMVLKEE